MNNNKVIIEINIPEYSKKIKIIIKEFKEKKS